MAWGALKDPAYFEALLRGNPQHSPSDRDIWLDDWVSDAYAAPRAYYAQSYTHEDGAGGECMHGCGDDDGSDEGDNEVCYEGNDCLQGRASEYPLDSYSPWAIETDERAQWQAEVDAAQRLHDEQEYFHEADVEARRACIFADAPPEDLLHAARKYADDGSGDWVVDEAAVQCQPLLLDANLGREWGVDEAREMYTRRWDVTKDPLEDLYC